MKPIKFKQQNRIYAKDQKPYLPLPVYEDNEQGGRVFHCWKLSFMERVKILFMGRFWIKVLNFHQPLQPIRPMVKNPFIVN
jgi:hypothetical protein